MLKLIDNLNLESLRESRKALDKWKKTYSRIFKIVEKIHKSVIKNKEESKTENEFVNRTAILKTVFKKDYEQRFIDFFIRHYTSKILVSDVIKLKLDNDCKNPMLDYDSFKFTIDTSNNESKIKNIGLFLRTANFSNTEINEHINTESYKKLESLFFKNSDITEWFEKFIYEIELNYNLQVNEMKKLIKFLDIVYNSLDEEKKIEVLKRIESDKELKNVYDGLCKYADVYKIANECRRNGKTLDYGLQKGVEKYKDTNIHIQNLLSKNKNLTDVIVYLHNSYYKTKYKNFNDF